MHLQCSAPENTIEPQPKFTPNLLNVLKAGSFSGLLVVWDVTLSDFHAKFTGNFNDYR